MSVINQVLSQLEQRGVQDVAGQVRPVSVAQQPDRRKLLWIAFAVVVSVLLGILLGSWLSHRSVIAPAVAPIVTPVVLSSLASAARPISTVTPVSVLAPVASRPSTVSLASSVSVASAVVAEVAAPVMPAPPAFSTQMVVAEKPRLKAVPLAKSAKPPKPQALPVPEITPPASVSLPAKKISTVQQAEAAFHQAIATMQQGKIAEALAGFETVLSLNPAHEAARQTWVALLLENKRSAEAERVLQAGLLQNPQQVAFAMLLARLQVERGALSAGLNTLETVQLYANEQADYQAFFAALLQRQGRHEDAVSHYQRALQQFPSNGVWLMGMGISLQALLRPVDAKDAFQRALNSQTLSPELQGFVQQRINSL